MTWDQEEKNWRKTLEPASPKPQDSGSFNNNPNHACRSEPTPPLQAHFRIGLRSTPQARRHACGGARRTTGRGRSGDDGSSRLAGTSDALRSGRTRARYGGKKARLGACGRPSLGTRASSPRRGQDALVPKQDALVPRLVGEIRSEPQARFGKRDFLAPGVVGQLVLPDQADVRIPGLRMRKVVA